MVSIDQRKLEHLDLCTREPVESARTTLLEEVQLLHEAIPELSMNEIDCSTMLLGHRLDAPIVISGMTGGTSRAGEINRALAALAQEFGFAMGLGSQRSMLENPELRDTYRVREVAPDIPLFANLGCVQARDIEIHRVADLVGHVGADALCIHLNVAQELVQDEGDRDFGGCLDAITQLVEKLAVPVVVKETGCGFSYRSLSRLKHAGVKLVDVAGVGGTTWPGVESLRGSARQRALGAMLRDWGIPTAASLLYARRAGVSTIASGGIRSAHDVIRALALGATAVGLALPFLQAYEADGFPGLQAMAESLREGVRSLMLLVGARTVPAMSRIPYLLGPVLASWESVGCPPENEALGCVRPLESAGTQS